MPGVRPLSTCVGMKIEMATTSELVERYRKAALIHGAASHDGRPLLANRNYDVVSAIYRELRSRGPEAQRTLLALLNDREPAVRVWAASHALEFAPTDGERVLESVVNDGVRSHSFTAKMVLDEWRQGNLSFP